MRYMVFMTGAWAPGTVLTLAVMQNSEGWPPLH